jgi:putative ABC transport system ATP-binding protein
MRTHRPDPRVHCPLLATPVVQLHDVGVVYGSGASAVRAIRRVSLEVRLGEVLLLTGPSGSGKTSLLQVIGLLLRPSSGQVTLRGEILLGLEHRQMSSLRRTHCGFVFQSYNLFPNLTAIENIRIAFELKGVPRDDAEAGSSKLIERVGLNSKRDAYPATLSGGQKQRIAVARALAGSPQLILADEPTAALDLEAGQLVMALLRSLADENNRAVVAVTHDARMTCYADRVLVLQDGQLVPGEHLSEQGNAFR